MLMTLRCFLLVILIISLLLPVTLSKHVSLYASDGSVGNMFPPNKYLPSAPKDVVLSDASVSSLTFAWAEVDSISLVTTYWVKISYSTDFSSSPPIDTRSKERAYLLTGLSPGDKWYFIVAAQNTYGIGSYSSPVSGTTYEYPGKVETLIIDSITNVSMKLSWSAPSDGGSPITSYDVNVTQVGVVWNQLINTGSPSTSFLLTGLTPKQRYSVSVTAITAVGKGSAGTIVINRTNGTPSAPTMLVLVLIPSSKNATSLDVSWHAPDDSGGSAITNYILYSHVTDGSFSTKSTDQFSVGPSTFSMTIKQLEPDVYVCVQAAAVNEYGVGEFTCDICTEIDAANDHDNDTPSPFSTTDIVILGAVIVLVIGYGIMIVRKQCLSSNSSHLMQSDGNDSNEMKANNE
eukprot:TRINITY_DN6215_c0_g1_i1.p1 TRINITY_DN6215_c0_g1~~TRINITY_DN6215_c0_g1_i1.p1  ORF type:complete len:403 (+),score=47.67 TRINITY_DN6215_c0_g1_i1:86-1294(+)